MNEVAQHNASDPKRRRTRAEKSAEARDKILNGAEYLFSRHGYYGVTIKDVAERVDVHPALVHYYFTDKPTLFDTVFSRRAGTSSQVRVDALVRYEDGTDRTPTVEGTIDAFLHPDFHRALAGDEGWRNFAALVAQVNNSPEWGGKLMAKHFDPLVKRLIRMLKKALPGAADEDLYWCYHFLSGALTLALSQTGRIDKLSGGLCRSTDMRAIEARMSRFMAAGFKELCKPTARTGRSRKPRPRRVRSKT
jgi:AcrR family transcriptional regulator